MSKLRRSHLMAACAFLIAAIFTTLSINTHSATAAQYSFNPRFSAETSTRQAGQPAKLTMTIWLDRMTLANPFEQPQIKREVIHMPAGMSADPRGVPTCPDSEIYGYIITVRDWVQSRDPNKPDISELRPCRQSRIGTVMARAAIVEINAPFFGEGFIVNSVRRDGEGGRVTIILDKMTVAGQSGALYPPMIITDSITVRSSDYGLDNNVDNIPRLLPLNPIYAQRPNPDATIDYLKTLQIQSMVVEFDGTLGASTKPQLNHPLLSNPTTCGVHSNRVELSSWAAGDDQSALLSDPLPAFAHSREEWRGYIDQYKPIPYQGRFGKDLSANLPVKGCRKLDYSPELKVKIDPLQLDRPAQVTTEILQSPAGEAVTKKSVTTFPKEMGMNISALKRLCSREDALAGRCPAESNIADVEADAQALDTPLVGKASLVAPEPGKPLGLNVNLHGLININLIGEVNLIPTRSSGTKTQIIFDNMSQVPSTKIKFVTFGGADGLIKTPKECGTYTFKAKFQSYSGLLHRSEDKVSIPCGKAKAKTKAKKKKKECKRKGKKRNKCKKRRGKRTVVRRGSRR